MLPAAQALIAELDVETATTRRVLERVPADRYSWQPHPKSLSAGQLAQHIALIPGVMARVAQTDTVDLSTRGREYASAENTAALLSTLDDSVAAARAYLATLDERSAADIFRLTLGDREIASFPRLGVMRTMCLNHWYHHRGELVVYLRLLGVSVPVVYGRSADESPFPPSAA
ncbi:MAG: DinB family protein [Vicinamibacterales bacterium]